MKRDPRFPILAAIWLGLFVAQAVLLGVFYNAGLALIALIFSIAVWWGLVEFFWWRLPK